MFLDPVPPDIYDPPHISASDVDDLSTHATKETNKRYYLDVELSLNHSIQMSII